LAIFLLPTPACNAVFSALGGILLSPPLSAIFQDLGAFLSKMPWASDFFLQRPDWHLFVTFVLAIFVTGKTISTLLRCFAQHTIVGTIAVLFLTAAASMSSNFYLPTPRRSPTRPYSCLGFANLPPRRKRCISHEIYTFQNGGL
jgi:hypothetical protein